MEIGQHTFILLYKHHINLDCGVDKFINLKAQLQESSWASKWVQWGPEILLHSWTPWFIYLTVLHFIWNIYSLVLLGQVWVSPTLGRSLYMFRTLHVQTENYKIWLISHSNFVYISYIMCTDCENDKIRLTSHSSFAYVSYIMCMDCENDKIQLTSH